MSANDFNVIKAEIERIRHHQDLQKKQTEENNKILMDVKNALVGSEMNGNIGLVNDVKKAHDKIDSLENFHQEVEVYVKQGKAVIFVVFTAIIGILVKLFTK